MWFQSLRLENFQGHVDTTLEFSRSLNTIVGPSNVGKTAITRALSLLLYNTWDGSWVRAGQKFCRLTLETSDGLVLVREKGEKINRYIVKENGKEQVFENFGLEIPEVISQRLGIFKAKIDATETLNVQLASQHDGLFLLSKPGSFKARVLGKLSGAHYLDFALRELSKEKKNLSAEKTLKEKELESLLQKVSTLQDVSLFQEPVEALEGRIQQVEESQKTLESLKSLFKRVGEWKGKYEALCQKEELLHTLPAVSLDSIEAMTREITSLKGLQEKLSRLNRDSFNYRGNLVKLTENIGITTAEYAEILKEAGVCPTCNQKISDGILEEICKC